jgi:hypothetical protein
MPLTKPAESFVQKPRIIKLAEHGDPERAGGGRASPCVQVLKENERRGGSSAAPNIMMQPTGLIDKHFAREKSKMLTNEARG